MARTRNDTVSANMTLDGKSYISELNRLQKEHHKLSKNLKNLKAGTQEFIDTNKRLSEVGKKMADYRKELDVTGMTISQLTFRKKQLYNEIRKNLTPGTKDYIKATKEFKKVDTRLKEIHKDLRQTAQETQHLGKKTSRFGSIFQATFGGNVAANVVSNLASEVQNLGKETLATSKKINSLNNELEKLDVENVEAVSNSFLALENVTGDSTAEIKKSFASVTDAYKDLSEEDAIDLFENSLIKAGEQSGEFLEIVGEYAVQYQNAGFEAEEFFKIALQEVNSGVFSDKLSDSVKELTLSLSEMTKAQQDALTKAFGSEFAKEISEGVNSGTLTVEQALDKIIDKTNESNLTTQQYATLTADLFKGAGEDVGGFQKIVEQLNEAEKQNLDTLNEYEATQKERLNLDKEIAKSQQEIAKDLKNVTTNTKNLRLAGTQLIGAFVKLLNLDIGGFFQGLYNSFESFAKQVRSFSQNTATNFARSLGFNVDALLDNEQALEKYRRKLELAGFDVDNLIVKAQQRKQEALRKSQQEIEETNKHLAKIKKFADDNREAIDKLGNSLSNAWTNVNSSTDVVNALGKTLGAIQTANKEMSEEEKARQKQLAEQSKELLAQQREEYARHAEELRMKREAYAQAEAEAEKRIQDLKISLIDDEFAQKRAKVELDHQRELEDIKVKGKQKTELIKLLEEEKNNKLAEIQQAEDDRKEQRKAEEIAQAKAHKDKLHSELEAHLQAQEEEEEIKYLEEQLKLEERFEETLEAEMAREQKLFELKQHRLALAEVLAEGIYGQESEKYRSIRKEILQNQIDFDKKEVENKKRSAELQKAIAQEQIGYAQDVISIGIELLSTDEQARKKNAGVIKAFTIGKIWADLAQEIAGYFTTKDNALTLGVTGTIKAAIATARATAQVAKVARQQFEKGGVLDIGKRFLQRKYATGGILPRGPRHADGGIKLVDGRTGQFTGYEIEGDEAVLSRETTRNNMPIVQDLLKHGSLQAPTVRYINRTVRYETGTERIGRSPAGQTSNTSSINAVNTEIDSQATESNMMLTNAVYALIAEIRAEKQMFRFVALNKTEFDEINQEEQNAINDNSI